MREESYLWQIRGHINPSVIGKNFYLCNCKLKKKFDSFFSGPDIFQFNFLLPPSQQTFPSPFPRLLYDDDLFLPFPPSSYSFSASISPEGRERDREGTKLREREGIVARAGGMLIGGGAKMHCCPLPSHDFPPLLLLRPKGDFVWCQKGRRKNPKKGV